MNLSRIERSGMQNEDECSKAAHIRRQQIPWYCLSEEKGIKTKPGEARQLRTVNGTITV